MDPKEHARFLAYLERFAYFHRPGLVKLDREAFLALDRELTTLLRTAPQDPRIPPLRRTLLRD